MQMRITVAALAAVGMLTIPNDRTADVAAPADVAALGPGDITLLPGYRHEAERGKDTRIGRIWKEGGLTVRYDIGRGAGNAVKTHARDDLLWYKEQVVQGRQVLLGLTKDRTLYVTFPQTSANFSGKTMSDEDLVDMLVMVLTYAPSVKP